MNREFSVVSLGADDNVVVSCIDFQNGNVFKLDSDFITVNQAIGIGHKIAVSEIACGEPVIKYCAVIGIATERIMKGDWVHTHNLISQYTDDR